MNRSALKSAGTPPSGSDDAIHSRMSEPGNNLGSQQSANGSAENTGETMASALSAETTEFLANVQAATKSGTAALNKAVQQNPTLALAGLVAVGALGVLAVRHYRAPPMSAARRLQGDVIRQSRSVRKAVRDELRSSGLTGKFDDLGATLSAIDWKPYIQPLIERASALADDAKAKVAAATKA